MTVNAFGIQVCEKLNVPLEVVPFTDAYWERVASKTVAEIKAGHTPNPDMMCNSQIKFGAFVEFLRRKKRRFDRIASGHYASIVRANRRDGEVGIQLKMSADPLKDQTYFLAQLDYSQLSRCMFPLGGLKKPEVRQLAYIAELPTCQRKDSQGICFLGKVHFHEFVERHLGKWPGLILEEGTRRRLGFHEGYWFHTIGQRSGLKMSGGPWYVTRKDVRWNVVYAQRLPAEGGVPGNRHDAFTCRDLNWIDGRPRTADLECKVRHGEQCYRCSVEERGDRLSVRLESPDQGLASGQFAVFYREGVCLGSGVICSPAVLAS